MKQTAVEWLFDNLNISLSPEDVKVFQQAKDMETYQFKDAYKHGRDDENCALSDGAMCPDYDNADEWYQGEYGGEQ